MPWELGYNVPIAWGQAGKDILGEGGIPPFSMGAER